MSLPITWYEHEGVEGGFHTIEHGYELSVVPPDEASLGWHWRVDLTSELSEWPEVYDCGVVQTAEEGKRLAEAALQQAIEGRKQRHGL